MTISLMLLALLFCIVLSGLFSGGETGLYSLSRLRVETEANEGLRSARIVRRLLKDDAWLLVTLLVANNVVNQATAWLGADLVRPLGVPPQAVELVATLLLTPPVFLFGELFPKDLFRRRPHALVGVCAPALAGASVLLLPLTLPLRAIVAAIGRLLGLDSHALARAHGRESVIELLREHDAELEPHVERMARNVLELRSLRVERVMVPWRRVETLPLASTSEQLLERLRTTGYSRLPVVGPSGVGGGVVKGYVHQLEVLASDGPQVAEHLRPITCLEPGLPLDRALAHLRLAGQRAALVGSPERPLGLVTLKDLLEEISGELERW